MSSDLIIERPDLQSWPLILGSRLMTAAMWAFYVYLWLPLVSLAAWVLGLDIAYTQMVTLGGYRTVLEIWLYFASGILILGGLLLAWARLNLYRFRGPDRRQTPGRTDLSKMARDFGLPLEQQQSLLTCRRAVLDHHPDGTLRSVAIDTGARPPAHPTAHFASDD